MNATIGRAAELERARIRARDAIFDWGRANGHKRKALWELVQLCPPALREAYNKAAREWAEYLL